MMEQGNEDNQRRSAGASPVTEEVFVHIERLQSRESSVRVAAAKALMHCGDGRASEALAIALRDEDWYVRIAAAKAMGKIGDARTVEALIAALEDTYASVREYAAEALGAIGDVRAVEALGAAYHGKDWAGRSAPAQALWQIGDATTLPLRILAAETLTPVQKLDALEALNGIDHRISQSNAKEMVIRYALGSVEGVCRRFTRSSGRISDEVRRGAESVLAELKQRAQGDVLLRASARPETQEKQELLRGVSGESASTPPDALLRPSGSSEETTPAKRSGFLTWIFRRR
ncbi:MAG: lyase domain protein repeat-containing protein [Chthonomonadales bacterium]|nr:lyase domain protein repeat-containing protein [Chthonomonadales bacterium]